MELAIQHLKFKRNGINLTLPEKEGAVLALLTRGTSAQQVANTIGVCRESLYQYKEQLLGKDVFLNKMKKSNDTDVNKLKGQVKQLQDEITHLRMQKDILEKAGEIIKKDQGIFLEELTTQETSLIDALRSIYKLSQLLKIITILKSSYCYHKKQLALPDKYSDVRAQIIGHFKKTNVDTATAGSILP